MTALIIYVATLTVLVFIAIVFRNQIRRFYIRVAEIFVLLASLILIVICGIVGIQLPRYSGVFTEPLVGFLLGSFVGLLISIVFGAIFFLLVEIAENTKSAVFTQRE